MKWEELTAVDFKKALKKSAGTCIIPLGCIEKHGEHLPLGTDLFNVSELACRIAEKEPVVVFPPYYLTQIQEAKHQPGTIAIKPELILKLLENACDETGRNGFKKIILLNGHGGNNFLQYFVMSIMLARKKSYVLYLIDGTNQKYSRLREKIIATKYDMHGGETETSITMFSAPELVKMECLTKRGNALGKLKHLPGVYTAVSWYANFPDHYAGDATLATRQKGELLTKEKIKYLATVVNAIKKDKAAIKLYNEFFSRTSH